MDALLVTRVGEVVDAVRVGGDLGIRLVGRGAERRAVAPAADDLRRELLRPSRVAPPRVLDERAERRNVHLQLPVDHERAVAVERRCGGFRHAAVLVRVAEQELAGRDVAPAAGAVGLPIARPPLQAGSFDRRLRDTDLGLRLLGADAALEAMGASPAADERVADDRIRPRLREQLGAVFDTNLAAGRSLSVDDAVASPSALDPGVRRRSRP